MFFDDLATPTVEMDTSVRSWRQEALGEGFFSAPLLWDIVEFFIGPEFRTWWT